MKQNYDVVVVGAGPGGVTVAALLANEGKKVLLVDKNNRIGGKMATFNKYGHTYELFPIGVTPGVNGLYVKLAEDLGKTNEVTQLEIEPKPMVTIEDADGVKIELDMEKPLQFFSKTDMKSPLKALKFTKTFSKIQKMSEEEIDKLWDISAYDYMKQFGLSDKIFEFFTASCGEGAFEMPSDRVPAANMIKMMQLIMGKEGRGRAIYYKEGIGGFFTAMATKVTDCGGEILLKTRVASINVKDGKTTGITTEKGETFHAPIVISSAGIRQTILKLTDKKHFNSEYLDKIANLEGNLACIGYRYFTNEPVLDREAMILYPKDCLEPMSDFEKMARGERKPSSNYVYTGTKSVYPGISPKGKQIIYSVMSCTPSLDQDFQPYLDYVERRVKEMYPKLFEEGVIAHREVMDLRSVAGIGPDAFLPGQGGEAYGIANSIGQTGPDQPSSSTPVDGLYIVGNDAGGFGLGTQQAIDSGYNVCKEIMSLEDK